MKGNYHQCQSCMKHVFVVQPFVISVQVPARRRMM